MTQAETRTAEAAGSVRTTRPPSLLVALVAKDGAAWLRQCLVGLSRQTYQRLRVVAIDNASVDGGVVDGDDTEALVRLPRKPHQALTQPGGAVLGHERHE